MGKGDKYRPFSTTRQEYDLRCKYATTDMTFEEFERAYKRLIKRGLIKRSGRILKQKG